MKVLITGMGIWARGLYDYGMLRSAVAGERTHDAPFVDPKPEAISSRERRRAGLLINLAVTVAHQACEHAHADKTALPSVFVSAMGDTDITDYMCRKLAQPDKLLSPTKFHNSVHNAPSGYWSISAQNHAPSTFVGGYVHSFGAGLFEAASQVQAGQEPVLLVAYDIANRQPFNSVTPVDDSFGCALVLAPADSTSSGGLQVAADLTLSPTPANQVPPQAPLLQDLYAANPAANSLKLLEKIVSVQEQVAAREMVEVAAAPHLSMNITLTRQPA